jgi:hypothetical protein
MNRADVPEVLARYLTTYGNPYAPELLERLADHLRRKPADEVALLRAQLQQSIVTRSIVPESYNRITRDNECVTQDDVQNRLLELWQYAFGEPFRPEQTGLDR